MDGRTYRVHRLSAYVYLNLSLSSRLQVLHKCDNPPCFNPEHLFIGTAAENAIDSMKKGRRSNGTIIFARKKRRTKKVMECAPLGKIGLPNIVGTFRQTQNPQSIGIGGQPSQPSVPA